MNTTTTIQRPRHSISMLSLLVSGAALTVGIDALSTDDVASVKPAVVSSSAPTTTRTERAPNVPPNEPYCLPLPSNNC